MERNNFNITPKEAYSGDSKRHRLAIVEKIITGWMGDRLKTAGL